MHTLAGYLNPIVDSYGLAVVDFGFGSLAESRVVEVLKMRHFETIGVNDMEKQKLREGKPNEVKAWGLCSVPESCKSMRVETGSSNRMK
jgi:hypothetical protein